MRTSHEASRRRSNLFLFFTCLILYFHYNPLRCFFRRSICVFLPVFIIISGCSSTIPEENAGEPVKDNLSMFNIALNSIFQQIDSRMQSGLPVYFRVSVNMPVEQQFAENGFFEYMTGRNRKLFLVSEDNIQEIAKDRQPGYIISMLVEKMNIEYNFENKKLSRNLTVQVFCNTVNRQDGAIVTAQTFNETGSDYISENDITHIQNSELSFTRAELPKKRTLRDLIEASAVLAAAGTIIYLLFSTRS